jgi:hypothetical protein
MTDLLNARRLLPETLKRPAPGEVDRFGNIGTADPGARLVRGATFVLASEVERARSFGWEVVEGVTQPGWVLVERQLSKADGTWRGGRRSNVQAVP